MRLISDITVQVEQQIGSDRMIVAAMQASTRGGQAAERVGAMADDEIYGRLRYLLKHRHTSPLEHGYLTVSAHVPAFVWWEWVRHRYQAITCADLSFNLESGRYRELEPVFWLPRRNRPMAITESYKPARPRFDEASDEQYGQVEAWFWTAYECAWRAYQDLLQQKIAPEVARGVLGFGVYYSGYCSGNPLAWLHFLARRTHNPAAEMVSHPQAEIQEAAQQVEMALAAQWPLLHRAWNDLARIGF